MTPYSLLRPLLFALDPERAHALSLAVLARPPAAPLLRALLGRPATGAPVELMGLRFANRLGLAAGLDKDGRAVDAFAAMGFGFVEVGTVTPRPQPGNPRPRLFRLPAARALINRFGFNNGGAAALAERVAARRWDGVLGINIGKNADTPNARALEDYCAALRAVHAQADYVAINISSPNTRALRELQGGAPLDELLAGIAAERDALAAGGGRRAPLVVKIAPDLDDGALDALCAAVRRHRIDGVIACNTTLSREGVAGLAHGGQSGGLSGAPLRARAAAMIAPLRAALGPSVALIAAGGIESAAEARARLAAGADLVQLYTALIYHGPALVNDIAAALAAPAPTTN